MFRNIWKKKKQVIINSSKFYKTLLKNQIFAIQLTIQLISNITVV